MTLEHVDLGSGPPVLFVHGSPGGTDQGELMTRFLPDTHRVVAPSRPGYRGTPLTDDTRPPAAQELIMQKVLIAVEESEPLTEDTPLPTHLVLRQSTRAIEA